ncbi:MAG: hypothetical protein AB7E48_09090 [Deferribacterales bacterium]
MYKKFPRRENFLLLNKTQDVPPPCAAKGFSIISINPPQSPFAKRGKLCLLKAKHPPFVKEGGGGFIQRYTLKEL